MMQLNEQEVRDLIDALEVETVYWRHEKRKRRNEDERAFARAQEMHYKADELTEKMNKALLNISGEVIFVNLTKEEGWLLNKAAAGFSRMLEVYKR